VNAETARALVWKKSPDSGLSNCVEVAVADDRILLRDSKDPSGPHLSFPPTAWRAFLQDVGGLHR
jgi:hypothetical protein